MNRPQWAGPPGRRRRSGASHVENPLPRLGVPSWGLPCSVFFPCPLDRTNLKNQTSTRYRICARGHRWITAKSTDVPIAKSRAGKTARSGFEARNCADVLFFGLNDIRVLRCLPQPHNYPQPASFIRPIRSNSSHSASKKTPPPGGVNASRWTLRVKIAPSPR